MPIGPLSLLWALCVGGSTFTPGTRWPFRTGDKGLHQVRVGIGKRESVVVCSCGKARIESERLDHNSNAGARHGGSCAGSSSVLKGRLICCRIRNKLETGGVA